MEPMQYTASVVNRSLLSRAMSAMPDAPVLAERASRRRRIAAAWRSGWRAVRRAVGRPGRRRRVAIRHRPAGAHATPTCG
jgi:hypothetical protein